MRSSNCSSWAGCNVSTVVARATPLSTSTPTQTGSESRLSGEPWPRPLPTPAAVCSLCASGTWSGLGLQG